MNIRITSLEHIALPGGNKYMKYKILHSVIQFSHYIACHIITKHLPIQSNLRTTAMHGDEPFGLCIEFDLISEFF